MSDKKLILRNKVAVKFAEMICNHHSLSLDPNTATIVAGEAVECMGMNLNLDVLHFHFDGKDFPFPKRLVDYLPEFILEDRMSEHIRLKDLKDLQVIVDAFKPR